MEKNTERTNVLFDCSSASGSILFLVPREEMERLPSVTPSPLTTTLFLSFSVSEEELSKTDLKEKKKER
jgi:hypothetical protein